MTGPADKAAAAFAELLTLLGIDDASGAPDELRQLVDRPWAAHTRDPETNRSSLTESGAPFEISVKLDADGQTSLRYVVDVADHSRDLIGNTESYLDAARRTTGQPAAVLSQLLACHLGDARPGTRPTVMHGVGLAAGRRRSSLYFPTAWLEPDELVRRLPGQVEVPGPAQVVGYDFAADGLAAWKTYHWLPVDRGARLADHPDVQQHLPCAAAVYDRFAADVPPRAGATCAFLQRKVGPSGLADKVFFFSRPWGWATPDGLAELLALLAGSLGADLGVLRLIGQTTRSHGLPLQLGLVSVGGDASFTFYFWPL